MPNASAHHGMGAIVHDAGVAFRVWAPNADAVFVTGSFNDWSEDAAAMAPEEGGVWYVDVPGAKPGDEYRFLIHNGDTVLSRIDPYARAVTTSVGNDELVPRPRFGGGLPVVRRIDHDAVCYEMHVGTGPATARISETSTAMMSWRRLEKATGCSGPPKLPLVLTAR